MRDSTATRRASACSPILQEQGFLVGEKDHTLSLGKCDRCGTVVEPRLSEQWFIKIKPLAERAIAAVESGEITIVPENYQHDLSELDEQHPRLVHLAAVVVGTSHSGVDIATSLQAKSSWRARLRQRARNAAARNWSRITDVLDTWFSSGLLPFTTLGWPEKTRDQEVFYPTTLLITAYEILFFWVARMIMFGCHFMKDHEQDPAIKQANGWGDKKNDSVPFHHVYIHALVRDADRQKMSKTKGNVIDPLDIIERFGTDATRFTLAAMAAPGTDIAFSESRTDGYRAFANKIWNAARFMFMNVDRIEPGLRPGTARGRAVTHGRRRIPRPARSKTAGFFRALIVLRRDVNDALATLSLSRGRQSHLRFFLGRVLRLVSGTDQAAAHVRRRRETRARHESPARIWSICSMHRCGCCIR